MDPELRFKWMDDLTVLEIINLLTVGISSFNSKLQVPNDIPVNNGYISKEALKTQDIINKISLWTSSKKMRLNYKKSHIMNFNFTTNYQFTTRIQMEGHTLPVLSQTKLLGVVITSDLRWSENTKHLIKRANARMELLRRMVPFSPQIEDMKTVYITYIRNILEQSCTIWHSDLTMEDRIALERVQKNAFRNILQEKYESYNRALVDLNMETLYQRRENLLLTYEENVLLYHKQGIYFHSIGTIIV